MKRNLIKDLFVPHHDNDHKPHFFREASITAMLVVALVLFATSFGSSYIIRNTSLLGNVYSSVLVDLTNSDRVENNTPPLAVSPLLVEAATLKVNDMVAKNYFAHTSPDGISPWFWFDQAGYKFIYAGENLAVGFNDSEDVNQGWLDSPTHKANIINAHFTEIGIATAPGIRNGKKTTYVVQMFGQPKKVTPTPSLIPTASASVAPSSTPSHTTPPKKKTSPVTPANAISADASQLALVETTVSPVYEDSETMIVKDTTETAGEESLQNGMYAPVSKSSPWYARVLANQPLVVNYILTALIIIITLALLVFLFHEIRIRHYMHFIYGLALLVIVVGLTVLNHSFFVIDHFLR